MSITHKYQREAGVRQPTPFTQGLGERIRERLAELDWKQAVLARRAKITNSVVCRLCQGLNDPCLSTAVVVAEVLGLNLEWLATGNGQKYREAKA